MDNNRQLSPNAEGKIAGPAGGDAGAFLQLPRSQSSRLRGKRCSEVLTMEKIRELEAINFNRSSPTDDASKVNCHRGLSIDDHEHMIGSQRRNETSRTGSSNATSPSSHTASPASNTP